MPNSELQKQLIVALLGFAIVIMSASVVSAAVAGSFESSYDGYGDGESTSQTGNEIGVEGTIEVTGESAVDAAIVIEPGEYTVLDPSTVQVFVEGSQSVSFDKSFRESSVVLRTDEIPSGTTLRVEFATYYTGGTDASELQSAEVTVRYDRPNGDRTQEQFPITTSIEDAPEQRISELKQGDQLGTIQRYLSYFGAVALIGLAIGGVVLAIGGKEGPGS